MKTQSLSCYGAEMTPEPWQQLDEMIDPEYAPAPAQLAFAYVWTALTCAVVRTSGAKSEIRSNRCTRIVRARNSYTLFGCR